MAALANVSNRAAEELPYYTLAIRVFTNRPCQVLVEIYKKSVYRDANGNSLPIRVTRDFLSTTYVKVKFQGDGSTKIRISAILIGENGNRNCATPMISMSAPTSYDALKVTGYSEKENYDIPSTYPEYIFDTIDENDVDRQDKSQDAQISEKVRAALNGLRLPSSIDFDPPLSPYIEGAPSAPAGADFIKDIEIPSPEDSPQAVEPIKKDTTEKKKDSTKAVTKKKDDKCVVQ